MERHQFLVLHLKQLKGYGMVLTHNQLIGFLCWQKCSVRYPYHLLKMSVNGVSTIFGLAS